MDKRRDGRHPAKHTNSPKVLQEDEQERKRRLHEERKTELERELIIARLSANLESILTPRDPIASKVLKIRDEIRGMLMTEIEINLLEREFEKKIEEGNWSAAQKRDIQARLKELLIQVRDNL